MSTMHVCVLQGTIVTIRVPPIQKLKEWCFNGLKFHPDINGVNLPYLQLVSLDYLFLE